MMLSRTFTGSLGAALALFVAGCSFQNFDYLKDEYKPAAGGASGSGGSLAGSGGGGGSIVAMGGSNAAGSSSGGSNSGGSSGSGGDATGEAGAPPEVTGMLLNPSFELGSGTNVTGWQNVGNTAAATVEFREPYKGGGRLGHWLLAGAYTVSTSQVVKPLPDGNYTFSIWIMHSLTLNAEYIFAKGYSLAEPAAQMKLDTKPIANQASYTQIVLEHIPVTSGQCEVGIYTDGGPEQSTNWSDIDFAEFTLEPPSGG